MEEGEDVGETGRGAAGCLQSVKAQGVGTSCL